MIKKAMPFIGVFMAAVMIFSLMANAQVRTSGSISGHVTDDRKEPLPGATVAAISALAKRSAITDANGYYRLPGLPPAKYTITVELDQFSKQTRKNLEVNVASMVTINFEMVPKSIMEKEIVVTALAPLIETEKTTMDTVISNTILSSLPILGRDFMSSLMILPGVTDSDYGISISGGRDTDKNYNIDGTDNIDIIQGAVYGGGSYGLTFNKPFIGFDQEAIQELSVGRGSFSADIGFGSGGLINVVTKSGSNVYHGSLYLYARSDNWDSEVPYAYHDHIFGGSLGGVLVKDKLLFFASIRASYNKSGYDPREVLSQGIPSDLQDISRGFSSFLKFTYLINNKHTLNFSLNLPYNKSNSFVTLWHVAPDFPNMTYKNSGFSLTLNETANLSSNLLLEGILSAGQTVDKEINDPNAHHGFIYILWPSGSITATGTYGADSRFRRSKINWSEKMILFINDLAGSHTLESGFEVRFNSSSQQQAMEETIERYIGFVDAKTITDPFIQKLHQTYVAGYISDSWRPVNRLTLKPGLRISRNSYRPKVLFEPRFDFAFDPIGDAKTIIRGGTNIYFERMNAYVQQFENYPLLRFEDVYASGTVDKSVESYRSIVVDQNLTYPKTTELSIGIDREIVKDLSFSTSFIYRKYRDQLFSRLINLRDRTTKLRDDPTKSALTYYSNSGKFIVFLGSVEILH